MRAGLTLLAVLDANADEERRLDGAVLIAMFLRDVRILRSFFVKLDGDDG